MTMRRRAWFERQAACCELCGMPINFKTEPPSPWAPANTMRPEHVKCHRARGTRSALTPYQIMTFRAEQGYRPMPTPETPPEEAYDLPARRISKAEARRLIAEIFKSENLERDCNGVLRLQRDIHYLYLDELQLLYAVMGRKEFTISIDPSIVRSHEN